MTQTETAVNSVRIAQVRREFGVHGAMTATPLGGDVDRFTPGLKVQVENETTVLTITKASSGPQGLILSVEEIKTPEDAKKLRNQFLIVSREQRRPLGSDEWFIDDLIGLQVESVNGESIGTVSDVEEQPAHHILVVTTPSGEQLIPMVSAFVDSVDIAGGKVLVTPWEWED